MISVSRIMFSVSYKHDFSISYHDLSIL